MEFAHHVHINLGTEKHVKITDLSDSDIEAMTVPHLKKLCKEKEITVRGKNKDDFVEAIKKRRTWMQQGMKQVSDPRSTTENFALKLRDALWHVDVLNTAVHLIDANGFLNLTFILVFHCVRMLSTPRTKEVCNRIRGTQLSK